MSEEELNENYIRNKLKGICQDCMYLDKIVPIIREMLSEQYINGLEQSRFDKRMLEEENQSLKKQLEENKINHKQLKDLAKIEKSFIEMKNQQKEFIEYLEEEMEKNINWYNSLTPHDKYYYYKDYVDKDGNYMVVLSKYKEIIGVEDNER